jgi:hypothetical protein
MDEVNYENISDNFKETIKQDLSPISPTIYSVLETAQSIVPECIELFERHCGNEIQYSQKIYRLLYPSLMRAIMQILLNSKKLETKALFECDAYTSQKTDWERIILSNNGLAGKYAEHNYKILKAIKGDTVYKKLPPPGFSNKKKQFYCQDHLLQVKMSLFPSEVTDKSSKHNVIYLWENPTKDSVSLYLACPKWGNGNKVEAYFVEPIEHPILSVKPKVGMGDIETELDLEKLQQTMNDMLQGEKQNEQIDLREQN